MSKTFNMNSRKTEEKEVDIIKELQEIEKYKQKKESPKPVIVVEFSWKLVLLVVLALMVAFLGEQLLTVFIFLFGGFVFMSAARPIVSYLMSKKLSKGLSVFFTYLLGIILLTAIISVVILPFIDQIDGLIRAIPGWIKTLTSDFEEINIFGYIVDPTLINKMTTDFIERLSMFESFENIASTIGALFSSTALVLACIIFSIYLVIDHDNILELGLIRITSDTKRNRVKKLILDVEHKLGRWLLGQALVSTIAGITMGVILVVLKVPFALPMGVFVALMSAIPTLGATLGAIPPLFVALVIHGPVTALIIIVLFFIYQQIENNIIIPKVMGNVMGLKPIFVMFTAASFFILFGVWGAVLAVPAIVILRICYEFYIDLQKLKAKGSI
ncbi:hypothetical protein CVU76_02830 [Candidatus Dojkabacteria bacterium HGW-Dojkabacteria-1]|uniref:AI-2E family transporter n=1 Tax=Candidatus Dojkabacteria bacterium HGW-Dojkabacteria-1 TaxID=2013761 RepID=A0A2N2F3Z1_9BACT|nr:MAG: hypothetical protein CVU76_02830 [Candidatus Dojkabacteria bacterium HGW-Dojkabacteria-1]